MHAKRPRVTVEEVEDEDADRARKYRRFTERYPGPVAVGLGEGETSFWETREDQEALGQDRWAPFADEEEWELARWLMKNVNQGATDAYLKLPITKQRTKPTFKSNYTFLRAVDKLPTGPEWKCEAVTVQGDRLVDKADEDGDNLEPKYMEEELEFWRRNPLECIADLMGNPEFDELKSYEPERVYTDEDGHVRRWDEMWTGDWWWEMQGRLPSGAVVAPVLLASDKTTLSLFKGDQSVWPVYLSIGNISKDIRRQPSSHATVLIGYIPVAKLNCFTEGARPDAQSRLFHHCMSLLLDPLVEAGRNGVEMVCSDKVIRRVFPILAAYIADHPEQCLITCVRENRCPRCTVGRNERGEQAGSALRDHEATALILRRKGLGEDPEAFITEGLRPIYSPFWADLPHVDIFRCISPDILHQLHKGVFKDHLFSWCTDLVGTDEIDARFRVMPDHPGLRHFKKGISFVSQWTGGEHKQMEKVVIGVLAGVLEPRALAAAIALLDFIYYAQYQSHTTETLTRMQAALDKFHENKAYFIEEGIRKDFNIPKLHSLIHYLDSIRYLGSLDGLNTESSERLHIDYAKKAYRASSRKDYVIQMSTWLRRQEAIDRRTAYLAWLERQPGQETSCTSNSDSGEESDCYDSDDPAVDLEEESEAREATKSLAALQHSSVSRGYQIAKKSPFPLVSVEELEHAYSAGDFVATFEKFLGIHLPAAPSPNPFDRFDTYKAISILRPSATHCSDSKRIYRIRSTPAISPNGWRRRIPAPARFDTALVIEDEGLYRREGGMAGLCVAQIRAIFTLPAQFGTFPHPLVYVHWFRPLRTLDRQTGMYRFEWSTRNRQQRAEIVSADRILQGCHVIPCLGPDPVDASWTTENVLDRCAEFYLNSYADFFIFEMVQLVLNN
ncbi:hypothetical protein PLICRDRAFT_111519 [Plicaturopsis crispa FD-325 SS-3]|nr:hypothetical protein PLICRDRAFT_111519 [Plicaturopsis crispa FD-325 SS-3]